MSHPFGDLIAQHLHRKHGLSQSKLAAGILQSPSVITDMCQGKRLSGPQARQRVTAIIAWLQQQGALATVAEANALLNAAGMTPLQEREATEVKLIQRLPTSFDQNSIQPKSASLHTPLATRNSPHHNLPLQLTPFIGRTEQIGQLVQQVQTRRLLTLTGAGGVGKTRLALEIAAQIGAEFADGVWFVDLTPLSAPDPLPQRILDLWRVPEQPERTPLATLVTYLRAKQMLLILDNCEHLLDACAPLAETLLQQCSHLALLATSREALNIQAETPWRVPSLTRPRFSANGDSSAAPAQAHFAPDALRQFEAVALFVARAHAHQPGFALTPANAAAVAHICSRLDGIPLALEMAAARVNVFTVEELATRLDGAFDARFQLLTNGVRTAPFRQQTLWATLEWSYGLLTPTEQQLLARLAVFSGGWTAAAAEEVTGAPLGRLAQLVNKSLVIADQHAGQTRYRLLETVRQFATEQLRLDEQAQRQTHWQHSRYYLHLLGEQEEPLQQPQQRTALDIIRSDFANISAAWQWAVDQQEFDLLAPAVHALFLYCEVSNRYREGTLLLIHATNNLRARLTMHTDQAAWQALLGQLYIRLGACEVRISNYAAGEQHLQTGLQRNLLARERIFALAYLGLATNEQGDLPLSRTQLQESLSISQQYDDWAGMGYALHWLAAGASDYTQAIHLCSESLTHWRKVGRPDQIADLLALLGWYQYCYGEYAQAKANWQEGLELCQQVEPPGVQAFALGCIGFAAWGEGDWVTAEQSHRQALSLYSDFGRQMFVGMSQAELALVLASSGQMEQALRFAQAAVATARAVNGQMMLTLALNYRGAVLLMAGDLGTARPTLIEAIQRGWEHQYYYNLMTAFYYFAELLIRESDATDLPDTLKRKALALTLLSCVQLQPATWRIFKDKAAQLQSEIEAGFPADMCATAIARGQRCTLEEVVNALLGAVIGEC